MTPSPVTQQAVRLAADLSAALPAADVRRLAVAAEGGSSAIETLHADAAGPNLRAACASLLALDPLPGQLVAGALLGALHARVAAGRQVIDVVWTGPTSEVGTSRLTSAVVVDLIASARSDVLLVGYAVHTEPSVAAALDLAAQDGVEITLLLERNADNPHFAGSGAAFPSVPAVRWVWPAWRRPPGASLHAKVLVVDGEAALIGSANVTGAALGHNLECGLLLRGGPHPRAVRAHIRSLHRLGVLQRV